MSSNPIGALRHRVTLERPVRVAGDGGTAVLTWTRLGSAFARIEPVGGREIESGDGLSGRVTDRVLLRHRNDLLPEMRIVAGQRVLEIRAVLDLDGRRRWLQCLCEECVP